MVTVCINGAFQDRSKAGANCSELMLSNSTSHLQVMKNGIPRTVFDFGVEESC